MKAYLRFMAAIVCLICAIVSLGGLTLGANTSDRVEHGSAAGFDDLIKFTFMGWYYPTTATINRRFVAKPPGGSGGTFEFRRSGTNADQLFFTRARATTATTYETDTTPIATLNKWYFVALVYDTTAGAGQVVNMYVGDQATAVAEQTYGTATDGAGALTTDAANILIVGNSGTAIGAWQGRIGFVALHNIALTAAQIEQQRIRPFSYGQSITQLFAWYTLDGTNCTDLSGNGNPFLVVGATQSDGPPQGLLPWSGARKIFR